MFKLQYPHVECSDETFRSVAQTARRREGLVDRSGQVLALVRYVMSRRTVVEDFFQMGFDAETERCDRVFFTSLHMMEDFRQFGQFMSIDATCKTNRFNMPLVFLVGSDSTNKTCIFGMGLIQQEDIDSYVWILDTFRTAVGMHSTDTLSIHPSSHTVPLSYNHSAQPVPNCST